MNEYSKENIYEMAKSLRTHSGLKAEFVLAADLIGSNLPFRLGGEIAEMDAFFSACKCIYNGHTIVLKHVMKVLQTRLLRGAISISRIISCDESDQQKVFRSFACNYKSLL